MKQYTLLATLLLASAVSFATGSLQSKPTRVELIFFQHDMTNQPSTSAQPLSLAYANPSTVYSYHSIEGIYLANTITHLMGTTLVSGPVLGEKIHHALLSNYQGLLEPYNRWQHVNSYQLQAENEKQLEAIKDKLRSSHLNQVLFHIAWTLPSDLNISPSPFIFNSNTLSNDDIVQRLEHAIQGKITITGNKNFDINAEISLMDDATPSVLNFSRRMKKNQLNYIDSDKYGLLAFISNQ